MQYTSSGHGIKRCNNKIVNYHYWYQTVLLHYIVNNGFEKMSKNNEAQNNGKINIFWKQTKRHETNGGKQNQKPQTTKI